MRVGWLYDVGSYVGGAERTQAEFWRAAPYGVQVVYCQPGEVVPGLDRYVIHNCITYSLEDLAPLAGQRIVKYWNDVGSWLPEDIREWLESLTMPICCSPLQAEYMGLDIRSVAHRSRQSAAHIPPPVNLDVFRDAASRVNGDRRGAVSVGSWRNIGKGPYQIMAWAQENGGIEVYGDGPFSPPGASPVPYEDMPALLAQYETFVHLPTVIEPFGRSVVEAWAAGCEIVTNDLVGAKWWITEQPEALETAAEDFWKLVLS